MSIEITESELQAIMDDIRSNHESDELIAMLANDIPAPPRPTLARSITESNDFPAPPRPTLLRSITESNDIPEPPRPTLLRSITESNDIPAPPRPTLLRSTTNDFPAPLLPLSQCANDSPEPNPSDDELPCIASLQRPTIQRCTNVRLSPSQLETAFSGLPDRLPITAEEVDEIVQGFRKSL
jgi:hypothetical protein